MLTVAANPRIIRNNCVWTFGTPEASLRVLKTFIYIYKLSISPYPSCIYNNNYIIVTNNVLVNKNKN